MRKNLIILLFPLLLCSACGHQSIYNVFYEMPAEGWHQDSILTFDLPAMSTTEPYEVLIVVRHTKQYPYQNLWLFVEESASRGSIHTDTIEAIMADDYGRWLGAGNSRFELPLLYDDTYHFTQTEDIRFRIQQGMRAEYLKGITEIGLIIQQCHEQE